ncbi:hypothetical protein KY362_01450 [Candidatus Woesearchaeota archaeon]|nr:hypothetical protein [Candidatus Woesearchaeota archaeon]
MKELLAQNAIMNIPRLLGMVDRNKYSKTYGCFDRMFWNHKKSDFPSGMYQLGTLPLALIYKHRFPGNVWHGKERVKELSLAGIDYLEKCSHKDGTADEFYPFERALGATAFSLYAGTEAYLLLDADDPEQEDFFIKRADWMAKNSEPSVIANHQAGSAPALFNVYKITGNKKYLRAAQDKMRQALSWYCNEGWFLEYEGCDPGYLTFTLDFIAKFYKQTGDKKLIPCMKKTVEFCSYFMHPDNSYAGEYGSRNTGHYLPHGFEIAGKLFPLALQMNDRFLEGLKQGKNEFMEDDVYFFYNMNNYLQTYLDFNDKRPGRWEHKKDFKKYFPQAKIFVMKQGDTFAVISLAKGGVAKVFKGNKLVFNDAGLIGTLSDGRAVTSQIIDDQKPSVNLNKGTLKVTGHFNFTKNEVMKPSKQILFRLGTTTLGRSWKGGQFIKDVLIKRLITQKKRAPILYTREFDLSGATREKQRKHPCGITVTDKITIEDDSEFDHLEAGAGYSCIMVPSSRYYQESVLDTWTDLKDSICPLNTEKQVTIKRNV